VKVTIRADGASRGNPGAASIGVVLLDQAEKPLKKISRCLGRATNNQAEYQALIAGLEAAAELKVDQVEVLMDSELVIRQMSGQYRVKSPVLEPLYRRARELALRFRIISFRSVPRSHNAEADRLANAALDQRAVAAQRGPA
jgi:ribonuclease HI